MRELIRLGGDAVEAPWDGEEAIMLLPDLDAGATGSMTGGGFPAGLRPVDDYFAGRREEAIAYQRWLPRINIENRQDGILAAKALMQEGGVIAYDAPRHPFPALHPDTRAGLLEAARRHDPLCCAGALDQPTDRLRSMRSTNREEVFSQVGQRDLRIGLSVDDEALAAANDTAFGFIAQ